MKLLLFAVIYILGLQSTLWVIRPDRKSSVQQPVSVPVVSVCLCPSISLLPEFVFICVSICHLENLFLFLLRPDIIFKIPSGFLFLSPRHTFQFPLQFYFLADGFTLKLSSSVRRTGDRFEVHRSRLNSSSSSSAGF